MLNTQEVFSFLAVAKAHGFSSASRKTGLPKSTLSRHVQNLEERLALNLFQRSTRKLKLTPAGEDFFQQAETLAAGFENLERAFQSQNLKVEGLIRITAPTDAGSLFAEHICTFKEKHPDVHFELILTDERVDLIDSKIDIALRAGDLSNLSFIAKKVFKAQFKLYASKGFSSARFPDLTAENADEYLAKIPLIDFSTKPFRSMRFHHKLKSHIFTQAPQITTDNLTANVEFALCGVGVCALPSYMGDKLVRDGKLEAFIPEWGAETKPAHLVYPAQSHLPQRVRLFIDHLVNSLSV